MTSRCPTRRCSWRPRGLTLPGTAAERKQRWVDQITNGGPKVHAVVEVQRHIAPGWLRLPSEPWPRHVRLCGSTSSDEIVLLIATMASYGNDPAASSVEEIMEDFPSILPGGLSVFHDDRLIQPGCCCGLEDWVEWERFLVDGTHPWTGHSPAPLLELAGDEVHIWPDGAMDPKLRLGTPIVFTRSGFAQAVSGAAMDLEAFLGPLGSWLNLNAPRQAASFLSSFRSAFVLR